MRRYQFKTKDHPQADGRQANSGEMVYFSFFPIEEEGRLTVVMGRAGLVHHLAVMLTMLDEDPSLVPEVREAIILLQS